MLTSRRETVEKFRDHIDMYTHRFNQSLHTEIACSRDVYIDIHQ